MIIHAILLNFEKRRFEWKKESFGAGRKYLAPPETCRKELLRFADSIYRSGKDRRTGGVLEMPLI